ncbi:LysE family translocator [Actinoplanes sp. TRM 88003]|uniref:LysE family translocator n=1 Tax=Paractinoplanes aksuensis TaxID=2939490 RepID=A0ABT1DTP0_9ACTN|nr:LysE family translocator [Actinoplanes aksuensis]MCO8274217.1 LysE family translocator [Actinoplanes aksuensis]
MATGTQVLVFAGVVALGAMSPGPDFAVVVRHAIVSGRARGIAAATGIAAGVLVWAAAAATGIAALIAWAPGVLTGVKVVGAAYLIFLGVRAWRSGGSASEGEAEQPAGRGLWVAFRDGLLTNLLNPKAAVFFVALLPQFLPAQPGVLDTITLSATAVVLSLAWFVAVAVLFASFRRLLSRAAVRRAIDRAMGVVLIGLGVRLAVTTTR